MFKYSYLFYKHHKSQSAREERFIKRKVEIFVEVYLVKKGKEKEC